MTLEYMRVYRIYFSLSQTYELSETNYYKICRKVEDILIKSKKFLNSQTKEIRIRSGSGRCGRIQYQKTEKNEENTTQKRKRSIQPKPGS